MISLCYILVMDIGVVFLNFVIGCVMDVVKDMLDKCNVVL